jgi:ATP-dependent Clp protease protease subunit
MPVKKIRKRVPNDVSQIHDFNLSIRNREIYLHSRSDFDEELGVDFHLSTHFIKNLNFLCAQNNSNILVRMHEDLGGSWTNGMAIFDAMTFSVAPITMLVYSGACSMSSIILQAADNRVLMPHADLMVHFGTESEENSYLGFMSSADFRKKYTPKMLKIYAKRCIKGKFFQEYYKTPTEEKVMRFIEKQMKEKGDWWMDSEEAVNYGFADGVLGQPGFETIEKIRTNRKMR